MTAKDDMRKLIDELTAEMDKSSTFTRSGKKILNEEWPNDFANEIMITREEWRKINRALAGAALGLANTGYRAGISPKEKIIEINKRLEQVRAAQDILSNIHDRSNPT